jgi:hypothetical protein
MYARLLFVVVGILGRHSCLAPAGDLAGGISPISALDIRIVRIGFRLGFFWRGGYTLRA